MSENIRTEYRVVDMTGVYKGTGAIMYASTKYSLADAALILQKYGGRIEIRKVYDNGEEGHCSEWTDWATSFDSLHQNTIESVAKTVEVLKNHSDCLAVRDGVFRCNVINKIVDMGYNSYAEALRMHQARIIVGLIK